MQKQAIRSGVTLITLLVGEVWEGSYVRGTYCNAFVKMIEGVEGYQSTPNMKCPSHQDLGNIHIEGPAVFERHYHSYL